MLLRLYRHWLDSYLGIPLTIWFLSLVSLINRCGAMVVAFMTLYLRHQLHFDLRETGYVMVFFGAGAFLGSYLGGKLTDQLGYHRVQLWSLVLNGIMLLIVMELSGFWAMCVAVFALSVVSEIFRPANSVAIARHSTPETRTRSISLYRMAVNLGWTIAPAAGGMLVAFGWRWLFWADGFTCLLAALLLWLLIKPIEEVPAAEHSEEKPKPQSASPYRDRIFLLFAGLTVLNAIVFMQLIWTVPVFFKEGYLWPESRIGLVAALNGLVVFLVEMPLIYRIDGRRTPMQHIRYGLLLYALAYSCFLLPAQGALFAAIIFMIAISFGEMLVMPFSTNFVFDRAKTHGNQGQYMAIYSMAYALANTVAPLLGTQVIAAWGFHVFWLLLGAIALISLLGFSQLEKMSLKSAAPL